MSPEVLAVLARNDVVSHPDITGPLIVCGVSGSAVLVRLWGGAEEFLVRGESLEPHSWPQSSDASGASGLEGVTS